MYKVKLFALLIAALLVAILAFDLAVELGVAGGVPYVLPVGVAYLAKSRALVWVTSSAAVLLVGVGYLLSPGGGEDWKVITNRLLAVFAILVVAIFADVAGLARLRVEGHKRELETRVRERTARLDRANRDLDQFAHVAAHDLREPVRRQQMLVDFILEDHREALPEAAQQDLEKVREQCAGLLGLIGAFRALTGLGGGAEARTLDLGDLVGKVATEVLSDDPRGEVSVDLPEPIVAYPSMVEGLVRNLIQNAIAHGCTPLSMSFTQEQREGVTWVRASNSWRGDPATVTTDLLRPFVRSGGDSTGLGLNICSRIADYHQGELMMEATTDQFAVLFTLGER